MWRTLAVLLFLLASCGDEVEPAGSDAGASCRALFGEAPVYRDCGGDEESCAFHTLGAIRTCDQVCSELGAGCAGSFRTESGCERLSGNLGCEHPAAEIICLCTR